MAAESIQSAITPETVAAAQVEFDAQDRALLVSGRQRTLLAFQVTGVLASDMVPREWEAVAAWVLALIDHEPLKSSPAFVAHRTLLGSFANDLRNYARMAGEPIGLDADLRAASTQADERRVLTRIEDSHRAQARRLDDLAVEQAVQHRAEEAWTRPSGDWLADAAAEQDHARAHDHATEEAPIDDAKPTKPDDEDDWLL